MFDIFHIDLQVQQTWYVIFWDFNLVNFLFSLIVKRCHCCRIVFWWVHLNNCNDHDHNYNFHYIIIRNIPTHSILPLPESNQLSLQASNLVSQLKPADKNGKTLHCRLIKFSPNVQYLHECNLSCSARLDIPFKGKPDI